MLFFLATLVTASVFINDRTEGIWDRTLVAGITTPEMLIAHIAIQSCIVFMQCVEVMLYVGFIFGTENKGDNFTIIALLGLNGVAGLFFGMKHIYLRKSQRFLQSLLCRRIVGLLISVFCDSHTMANFVATGTFYPMIILCGLLWPLEGMPIFLRNLAYVFPFTVPTMAVRNVLEKGWTVWHPQVYNGFIVVIAWIIGIFVMCLIGLRRQK